MPRPRRIDHRWYGWRPQLPDMRDLRFSTPTTLQIPHKVDLSNIAPPIMNQGALGSCVAHGVTAAMRAEFKRTGRPDEALSRLQLYYDGRVVEGTVQEDSGLMIRTAIKCANRIGIAHEALWPYRVSAWKAKPPAKAYANARDHGALKYMGVQQYMPQLKAALASGFLIVFGIGVYESFESDAVARTGIIPMPKMGEKQNGGHCMYLYGYDDEVDPAHAMGNNSWGEDWGDLGGFRIPWDYLIRRDLASDFWVVQAVGPQPRKTAA